MDATTNIVMNAPNQTDTQNIKVTNQPKTVKLNDKNPQKNHNDFHSILGKVQDKDKAQDKTVVVKGKGNKQTLLADVKSETGLASQAMAMMNVASLPNTQILTDATLQEPLNTPSVNGVTGGNADFSKLLGVTNSNESVQTSLAGTIEQLLAQNDSGKTANQVMLDLLNGKTAGALSQTGNPVQKSLNIPGVNALAAQSETKATADTKTIVDATKSAVNFVSEQNDAKADSVSNNIISDLVKTDKQTTAANLLNVTAGDSSQTKPNIVMDAQMVETAKPVVANPLNAQQMVETVKPVVANPLNAQQMVETAKPVVVNPLNAQQMVETAKPLVANPLNAQQMVETAKLVVANPLNAQQILDAAKPTGKNTLNLNNLLYTTASNTKTTAPIETTQQLAKYNKMNVASLPNMQILAEATQPETLTTASVNTFTDKNADFSKLLTAMNSKEPVQRPLTGSIEELLPQNDSGKSANQGMLDLLNGKMAGVLSQTGNVDNKQINTLLQTAGNLVQKSLDMPVTNVAVVQSEIKAPAGTEMIANATKVAVNFVSEQKDTKVGIVKDNTAPNLEKMDKQAPNMNLVDVNQPMNVPVEGRSQAKMDAAIDAQMFGAVKPIIVKPSTEQILDVVKPMEKNILNSSNSSLLGLKEKFNEHAAQTPTQFSEMMVNSLHTTASNTGSIAPVETTTQQLAKYDIPGQIVEQARLIKTNEDTQMIIKLNPEHLGDLTLKVSIANGGAVTASFHSDNAQVRTMLENSMIQLKQELEAKGMKVDNVEVYAGLGDFMSNGQNNQANSQQQKSSLKNHSIDLAEFDDTIEKVSSLKGNISEDSVDYRI